jgi:hypothetical protein
MLCEQYKLWNFSLSNFLCFPATSSLSLLSPNIHFDTLFSDSVLAFP